MDNQVVLNDFVKRHVFGECSEVVNYILDQSDIDCCVPFGYESLNMKRYSYNGNYVSFYEITEDELQKEIALLRIEIKECISECSMKECMCGELSDICHLDATCLDFLEWHAISPTLGFHLMERGEVVIKTGGLNIWGRTESGMAIYMSRVIEDIYNELEKQKTV